MHGRGLLTLIWVLSFSVLALGQDEFDDFQEFGSDEAPAVDDSLSIGEPDPNSELAPKASSSSSDDDFTEFEESGGETPPAQAESPAKDEFDEFEDFGNEDQAPATAESPASGEGDEFQDFNSGEEAPAQVETPEPPMPDVPDIPAPEPLTPTPYETPVAQPSTPPSRISPAPDEPDYQKEERFHRIYRAYNQKPTSSDSWDKATAQSQAQVYNVQSGDTLWDVSQTLFGDPNFWPKIWSLNNDRVLNPHEISPEMRIRFFPGSMAEVPSVAVATPQEPAVVAEPPLAKAETQPTVTDEPPPMPPPYRQSRKPPRIPESLPLYRYGGVNVPKNYIEIDSLRIPLKSPVVYISHYVLEEDLNTRGRIKETESGMNSASEFQYVVVELNDVSQKIFHVAKDVEKVKNPFTLFGSSGRMIELQGEIEVLEKIPDEDNLYRAIVRKSIGTVEVGSQLLPGPLPRVDVSPTPATAAVEATLIGGQLSSSRVYYPKNSFVFIDAGSAAGLTEGQSLNVFANLKNRNEKIQTKIKSRRIGTIKVVKVTENFSTAFVTEATQELQIGDYVGGGRALPTGPSADNDEDFSESGLESADASGSSSDESFDDFGGDSGDDFGELELE